MKRKLLLYSFLAAAAGIGCSLVVSYDGYGDGVRADGGGGIDATTTGDGSSGTDGSIDGAGGDAGADASSDASSDVAVDGDAADKRYAIVILGGRVYDDAGVSSQTASVEYAMINKDGTLGAWKLGPPMPSNEDAVGAAASGSSVFVQDDFGGVSAVMLPDAGLSSWGTTTSVNRNNPRLVAVDGRLYLATGTAGNGTELPEVYYAQITGPQTLAGWTPTTALPADGGARNDSILVASGRTLYVLGGDINGVDITSVLMATIDGTGAVGAWNEVGPLTTAGDDLRAVVVQNHVTIVGGSYDVGSDRNVHTAQILDGGALGAWQAGGQHPVTDTPLQAVHGNYVYLISGTISSGIDTSAVIYSEVSTAGVPNTWQTTTSVNVRRHSGTAVVVEVPP